MATIDSDAVAVEDLLRRRVMRDRAYGFVDKWMTLIAFALMIAFFWIARPDAFGTYSNLVSILDESSTIILLAVGLTAVLSVAEFDLAFPYLLNLTCATTVLTMSSLHAGTLAAIGVGIGVGVVAGAIGGYFVALQRASSFIITLAAGFVWTGLADGFTNSQSVSSGLTNSFVALTSYTWLGFTDRTWIAAIFAVLVWIVIKWTIPGRYMLAVGSNAEASRLAGLRVSWVRVLAYAILGLAVGITGVLLMSQQAAYYPNVGNAFFLAPYVAAFFGMSVLGTHRFTVFGTVVGALFIGTLQVGLLILGASLFVGELIQGMVLLVILILIIRPVRR